MRKFPIGSIVADVGESFAVSGVSKSFNAYGDATESFTNYTLAGVVQVMDGTEDVVEEGILQKEDITVFVDDTATNAVRLVTENYIVTETTVSGVYKIVNSIKNAGHYEVYAKKI